MATVERKSEILIDLDAYKLAVRIALGVQKKIMQAALVHAAGRNAGAVKVDDVKSVAEEMDLGSICRSLGESGDGEPRGGRTAA